MKVNDQVKFLLEREELWGTLLEANNKFYLIRIDQFPTTNGFNKGDEIVVHEEEILEFLPKQQPEN